MTEPAPDSSSDENERVRALVIIAQANNQFSRSAISAIVEVFKEKIFTIARYFAFKFHLDEDDLFQSGCEGLFHAIGRFNLKMETPFWGFSRFHVETFVRKEIRREVKYHYYNKGAVTDAEIEEIENVFRSEPIFRIVEQLIYNSNKILSPLQQELIYERFYQERKIGEIASERTCSRNNIQKSLAAGLRNIRTEVLKNINNN